MKIKSAEFVTSAAAGGNVDGIPQDGLSQIAMAGRSNVGKSTLLNALCRKKVARTSAAPGKTRLANVYRVTVEAAARSPWTFYFVDLPGYGYARGGADAAAELSAVAEAYFVASRQPAFDEHDAADARHAAVGSDGSTRGSRQDHDRVVSTATGTPDRERRHALLLVDSRHPGLELDVQAGRWLSELNVDYRVVATKIDKLTRTERARNLKALEATLGMPPVPVSAASGEGLDALWKTIVSLVRTARA